MSMESHPAAAQITETEQQKNETEFIRLTAAELGFNGSEMVEYGPYTATVDRTLLECDTISHLGPDIARMAIAQGIELYKQNHPEAEEKTDENGTEEPEAEEPDPDEAKKKLS